MSSKLVVIIAFSLFISVCAFAAEKKGNKQPIKVAPAAAETVKAPQSAEQDRNDFLVLLSNMTEKTLGKFIKQNPNNYYLPFAKSNLDAVKEAGEGYGKFFLVLKNKTRLSIGMVTQPQYGDVVGFKENLVRVDPDTISHFELLGEAELEPYLEFAWGGSQRVAIDKKYYSTPKKSLFKHNSLLQSQRVNNVTKYKIKDPISDLFKPGDYDRDALIDLLKKNPLKNGREDFFALSPEDQLIICDTFLNLVVFNYGEAYFGFRSAAEMCEHAKSALVYNGISFVFQKLDDLSRISKADLLVAPSIHGKNDFFQFVAVYKIK